jgi:outer membrane biogenesis lipoprotein LolB
MAMTARVRTSLSILACLLLGACAGSTDDGIDCTSHYAPVASAPSWSALKKAMLTYDERGRVASVRTQERGVDVGAGDQQAVRVVDLLDRNGRRVVQVDVWRTDTGGWRAGAWSQCID